MSEHQIIYHEGKPAFVLVPVDEWERLMEDASDAQAVAAWRAGSRDTLPAEVVDRLIAGDPAIRVLRQHRGLSQAQLANAAGINAVYLSQIETGTRRGSLDTLQALARVLSVPLEMLTGWRD